MSISDRAPVATLNPEGANSEASEKRTFSAEELIIERGAVEKQISTQRSGGKKMQNQQNFQNN